MPSAMREITEARLGGRFTFPGTSLTVQRRCVVRVRAGLVSLPDGGCGAVGSDAEGQVLIGSSTRQSNADQNFL